jgi:Transcriptional regulators
MTNVLYLTIVEEIKKKIMEGLIIPGDMLKSESEMMKEYSVSRMTIRKSLSLLSNEGYIYSVPGKGNFVRKPEIDIFQLRFSDFDSLACETDEIKLISVRVEEPDPETRYEFGMKSGDQVVVLERLSFCEHKPIALEIVISPYISKKPVVEDILNFANYSKALESKLAFSIRKELEINVIAAPLNVAKCLETQPGDAIFLINKKIIKRDTNQILNINRFYIKNNTIQ